MDGAESSARCLGAPPGRANGRRRGRAFELVRLPARCLGGEAELRRSPLGFSDGSPLPSYPRGAPPSSPAQQHRRTLLRPVPSPPMIIPAQRVALSHPSARGREKAAGRLAILRRSLVRGCPLRSLNRASMFRKRKETMVTTTRTSCSDLCGNRVLGQIWVDPPLGLDWEWRSQHSSKKDSQLDQATSHQTLSRLSLLHCA